MIFAQKIIFCPKIHIFHTQFKIFSQKSISQKSHPISGKR